MRRTLLSAIAANLMLAVTLFGQSATTNPSSTQPRRLGPSLKSKAEDALANRDYAKGKELLDRWLEANPPDSAAWYDLACAESRLGNKDRAITAFENAIEAGYSDEAWPVTDSDLDAIRNDPRFSAAMARIKAVAASKGPAGFIRRFVPTQAFGTYIVMLPPDYQVSGKQYPLCLILHGNGGNELSLGKFADQWGRDGVIYVAVRAPYPQLEVMFSGQPGWTAGLPDNLAGTDPILKQNGENYVQFILNCARDVQSNYHTDKGKFHLFGYSQGGRFALICALQHPELIASVFSRAGPRPWAENFTAEALANMKTQGIKIHLLHGEQDDTVPPEDSKSIKQTFDQAGINCTLELVPGGHPGTPQMTQIAKKWIDQEVRSR